MARPVSNRLYAIKRHTLSYNAQILQVDEKPAKAKSPTVIGPPQHRIFEFHTTIVLYFWNFLSRGRQNAKIGRLEIGRPEMILQSLSSRRPADPTRGAPQVICFAKATKRTREPLVVSTLPQTLTFISRGRPRPADCDTLIHIEFHTRRPRYIEAQPVRGFPPVSD